MDGSLIFIFAFIGATIISLLIFNKIDKKYKFLNFIKQKMKLNKKFKSSIFAVLLWCLVNIIITKFISTTTIFFPIIEGFLLGILIIFI